MFLFHILALRRDSGIKEARSLLTVVIVFAIIGFSIYLISHSNKTNNDPLTLSHTKDSFSIASWNLHVFGQLKASNDTLLTYFVDKLKHYDLFAIEEIRDASENAIKTLAARLPTYHYIISERAGQSTRKEQYAIFYNNKSVLINFTDWTKQEQDNFERPPLEAIFKVNNWTFTIYVIHTKPSSVSKELTNLEQLVGVSGNDTIILGDLNADGDYYFDGIAHNFLGWHWLITSDMDTTVATSSNAYDRILINNFTENNFMTVEIMDDVQINQSDHYLIFAVFNPDEY